MSRNAERAGYDNPNTMSFQKQTHLEPVEFTTGLARMQKVRRIDVVWIVYADLVYIPA